MPTSTSSCQPVLALTNTTMLPNTGSEHMDGGTTRTVTQKMKMPGIFSAFAYFWLFYDVYPSQVTIVPIGQHAKRGEAHGVLDPTENYDADAVAGSHFMFEYAGVDASQPGLLYKKTLTCMCSICRDPASIRLSLSPTCPFWATTGKWQQATVNPVANVPAQLQKKRTDVQLFRLQMVARDVPATYAVYANQKELEVGGHPYWLMLVSTHPEKAPSGLKDAWGCTIRAGTWIVQATWLKCTSADPNHKAYKLLEEEFNVTDIESNHA